MGVVIVLLTFAYPVFGGVIAGAGLWTSRKNWKINVCCLAFFIAVCSYNYIPENTQPDLYRYFQYILSLRGYGLIRTLKATYVGSNLYALQVLVWICNIFSDEHLLPFITVWIIYWIGLYCTCYIGTSLRVQWKCVRVYLLMQVALLDWYGITGNIRNITAFAIVGFAIFRDVYQDKKDAFTALCYIAPIFLHPTSLVIWFARVMMIAVKSSRRRILLSSVMLFVYPIIQFANAHISKLTSNPIILLLVRKAASYYFDTSSEYGLRVAQSLRSLVARILYLSIIALFCAIEARKRCLKGTKYELKEKLLNAEMNARFSYCPFLFGAIALSCATMLRPEYWRFSAGMILFGGSILLPFLNDSRPLTLPLKMNTDAVIKALLLCLVPLAWMVTLWALTWTDWPGLIVRTLKSSPLLYLSRLALFGYGGSL